MIGRGCPGERWSPHSWRCLRDVWRGTKGNGSVMGLGRSGWWPGLVLKFFSNLDDSIIWKCFSTSSWTKMFFHQQTDLGILSRSFEQTPGFGSWGATWPHNSAAVGKMLQEARAFPAWGSTTEVNLTTNDAQLPSQRKNRVWWRQQTDSEVFDMILHA